MNRLSFNSYKLGDVTEIIAGGDKPKEFKLIKSDDFNVPVYANAEGDNGLQGYTNVARIIKPSVTVSARGSKVGFTSLRKQPFFPIVRLLTLIPKEDLLDVSYLYYSLKYSRFERSGSGQPQITIPQISNKVISIPDLPTQQKIASVLSALDDKIEINNKINAELEAMAKTLYDYWFVQFEFPNAEGKPYKSSGGKMVYSQTLKREIPDGWDDTKLGELTNLVRGVSYNKDDIKIEGEKEVLPILRATNIVKNKVDISDPVIVPSRLVSDEQILNPFDILITMSSGSIDHIGKNGFYLHKERVSFGAFCAKIVPVNNYKFYIYNYLQSDFVSVTIKNECLGTNINNLNSSLVNSFRIVNPDFKILEAYNKIVEPIFFKIKLNTQQNQELAQLRDWLLPMLMNGQVTVE